MPSGRGDSSVEKTKLDITIPLAQVISVLYDWLCYKGLNVVDGSGKAVCVTDSYGENAHIDGIQFTLEL